MEFESSEKTSLISGLLLPICDNFNSSFLTSKAADLSDEAREWMKNGERDTASETLFSVLTNLPLIGKHKYTEPQDIKSFRCCQLLIESVPEVKGNFHQMTLISPAWSRLVDRWKKIKRTIEEEAPQWRESKGRAPRTSSLIQGIFSDD
jgi:hypothetical protein